MRNVYLITALICLIAVLFTACSLSVDYYDDEDSYQIGSGNVSGTLRSLDISWNSGSVYISSYNGDEIILSETEVQDKDERMRYRLENGVLTVHYRESGVDFGAPKEKELEILIPQEQAYALQKLEIETAAASVTLKNLSIQTLNAENASGDLVANNCTFNSADIELASGDCSFSRCTIANIDIENALGDIKIDGSVKELEAEIASGNLTILCSNTPSRIDAETASGNIEFTLPADSQFTADYECLSGNVSISGFTGNYQSNRFVCGSSLNKYSFEAASGDIKITAK